MKYKNCKNPKLVEVHQLAPHCWCLCPQAMKNIQYTTMATYV